MRFSGILRGIGCDFEAARAAALRLREDTGPEGPGREDLGNDARPDRQTPPISAALYLC
jgi:hypothetical protein